MIRLHLARRTERSSLTLALFIFSVCHGRAVPQDDCGFVRRGLVRRGILLAFYWHEFGVDYNVVRVDIGRKADCRIIFWQCFKFGFPVMVSSVALSALYLWLVFLR
jgi:hypothetical protein